MITKRFADGVLAMRNNAKKDVVFQSLDKIDILIAKNKSIYNEWLIDRFPNYGSGLSSSVKSEPIPRPDIKQKLKG